MNLAASRAAQTPKSEMMHEQIVDFLTQQHTRFTVHEHEVSRTVNDAVERLPFPLERFLKTIAFRVKGGDLILAGLRGVDRVDYRKLAAAVGVKRDALVRLSPDEVQAALGVEPGSVGPVIPIENMRVIFDTQVNREEPLFCGIGRPDRTLEITLDELVRVTHGQVLPIAQEAE